MYVNDFYAIQRPIIQAQICFFLEMKNYGNYILICSLIFVSYL